MVQPLWEAAGQLLQKLDAVVTCDPVAQRVHLALQEQLSRLRQQDAGLKTHLDQLDQQISALQLGVCRSAGEAPDSDSRPSSGFYELSDAGSCSLSTSCASVCSDHISPSLGSLLPVAQPPKARPSTGDWRPRSADETTVPAWRPQASEEGSRPLGSIVDAGWTRGTFRPRPVSTGDLDRVLPADTELQPTSFLSQGTDTLSYVLDPKYQRDLVSKGGREVYPYPSPLHAVALQSPLFALTKEAPHSDGPSPPRKPLLGPTGLSRIHMGSVLETGPARAYIDRLLHLRSQGMPPKGSVGEQGPPRCEAPPSPPKQGVQRMDSGGQLEKLVCTPEREGLGGTAQRRDTRGDSPEQQGPVPLMGTQHPSSLPGKGPQPSPCSQAQLPTCDCGRGKVVSPLRRTDNGSPPLASGHFVLLPFAAREASPVRLRTGHPKTKAMRTKRRASDKVLRFGKQPLPLAPERQRGARIALQLAPEWVPSHRPQVGGGLRRRPTLAGVAPGRSCSESTLYPVPFFVPLVVARQDSCQASAQALFPFGPAVLSPAAGKQQRRWQSAVEISARARPPGRPDPPARSAGGPQAPSQRMLVRQDACTGSESGCSERSALAESSEDEASDHTANRFGDQESSGSSSEGAVQGGGVGPRELAWPGAVPRQPMRAPAGPRPPLPPVPKLCRIKASKALKKKIRRFQPAALKVMTMV
ncbi:PREDICTED: dapper homolog 2 [Galeopterus variegatus]|uniref:Dapper homolog 2 n=1 Tax=Galeopterus variegatus TaxID=482537 RepID=A0ABM0SH89_GALVR|nr:PREDICTED: dapper homolog 2 [Galeopterus variegatus]